MSASRFRRATTVVKLGGSCVEDLSDAWWDDLARQAREHPLVLVHGWSKPLRRLDPKHGEPSAFLRDRYGNQSRWTTPEVIDDILLASATLCQAITERLWQRDVAVSRLIGSDGLLRAGRGERWYWHDRKLVEIDNLVGPIVHVDPGRLRSRERGRCLLVTPLARDAAGRVVNTDADRAAAAVAGTTRADALVLVTDVPFLIVDEKPVRELSASVAAAFRDTAARGGMRKKLRAADEALDGGAGKVIIGSAPVTELLAGTTGTVITADRYEREEWSA